MTPLILPWQVHCHEQGPPWGTRALGLAILLVSLPVVFGDVPVESLMLSWSDTRPHQLVTSVLVHADLVHLLGNLFFLALYGKVVEGAIGTRAFLLFTLPLVLVPNLVELALYADPAGDPAAGSLGASGVVLGYLAAAFLLAPTAEITLFFRRFVRAPESITLRMPVYAGFVIAVELWWTLVEGGGPSSASLHLIGMVVALALAWAGLRLGWLDCDGWDRLSLGRKRERQAERLSGGPLTCPRCKERLPHGATLCPACGKPAAG